MSFTFHLHYSSKLQPVDQGMPNFQSTVLQHAKNYYCEQFSVVIEPTRDFDSIFVSFEFIFINFFEK